MRNVSLLFLSLIVLIAPSMLAQHDHPAAAAQSAQMPAMNCEAMMKEMHASSKAMDDRLQQLVDDMNKAKGSARIDRMAAVINELVTQRRQMREQMMTLMPKMMSHMSQHMQSGMSQSMAGCPMMKGAAKTPDGSTPEHKH